LSNKFFNFFTFFLPARHPALPYLLFSCAGAAKKLCCVMVKALPEAALRPRTLKDYFHQAAALQPSGADSFALCVIDVQHEFCNPHYSFDPRDNRGSAHTAKIATHIAGLAPAFRAAGCPLYMIYYDRYLYKAPNYADTLLYKVKTAPGDQLFPKRDSSAFADGRLDQELRQAGIKNLLLCGFNLNACVYDTARDGLALGYNICILGDAVGNDLAIYRRGTRDKVRELIAGGAVFARSDAVLRRLPNS